MRPRERSFGDSVTRLMMLDTQSAITLVAGTVFEVVTYSSSSKRESGRIQSI